MTDLTLKPKLLYLYRDVNFFHLPSYLPLHPPLRVKGFVVVFSSEHPNGVEEGEEPGREE